jgi:hypothetical protein
MHLGRSNIRRRKNMGYIIGGGPRCEAKGTEESILAEQTCERTREECEDEIRSGESSALGRTARRLSGSWRGWCVSS